MSKKKHILFLASWYPTKKHLTNGNFVQRHAEAISKKHRVTLVHVVAIDNVKSKNVETNNVNDSFQEIIAYIPKTNNPINKYLRFKSTYLELISTVERFDIIHLNVIIPTGFVCLDILKKYNRPLVITEHSTKHIESNQNKYNLLEKWAIKRTLRRAQALCPVSKDLENALLKYNHNLKSTVIHNVVDETIFSPSPNQPKKEKVRFLHVSTYNDHQKNITGLLRTIKKLGESKYSDQFNFTFIGDGDVNFVKQLSKKLEIPKNNITIHGEKDIADIASKMKNSDAFVLFSNYENSPCVISESHMTGIPVISTDVGGISEMIDESNGILIESRNENELLTALIKFIEKDKVYDSSEISKNAQSKYSKFTIANQYDTVYQNVC